MIFFSAHYNEFCRVYPLCPHRSPLSNKNAPSVLMMGILASREHCVYTLRVYVEVIHVPVYMYVRVHVHVLLPANGQSNMCPQRIMHITNRLIRRPLFSRHNLNKYETFN